MNFQATLNKYCPDRPMNEAEVSEALRNLAGFMGVLMAVNERAKIVQPEPAPTPPPESEKPKRRKRGSHAG